MSSLFDPDEEPFDPYDQDDIATGDTIAPFLPAKESSVFFSDQNLDESFIASLSKDTLPHAIILSGPKGIGKATFAYRLARFLFKYGKQETDANSLFGDAAPIEYPKTMDMNADDPVFRRIVSGGYPDFMALEPLEDKKGLDVAQIRKVAPFLRRTASEDGGWRIVLVDDADTMNRSAQNALLKILEEPPARAMLILVTHNIGAFLPTIRSRCRLLDIDPPNFELFLSLLQRQNPDISSNEAFLLYEYSSGSIGKALQFIDFQGLETFNELITHLSSFPEPDFEKIHFFCEQFGKSGKEQIWRNFSDLIQWIFQTLALSKARNKDLITQLSPLSTMNNLWSLEEQLEICQMLESKLHRADFANLDKKQTALEIFMLLHQHLAK